MTASCTATLDDDYLYFFAERLEKVSQVDTDWIWRLLELEPQMQVLDLGCGHGRIANRLAERGCRVTGLDLSPTFLKRAREDAANLGVTVDYIHGDILDQAWARRFDRVVNWGNVFNYFDDDADGRRVLVLTAEALKADGQLLIDTMNYPSYLRDYQPSHVVERDGNLVVDQHWLDPLTSRSIATRTVFRDGDVRREPSSSRVHTFPELRDWLRAAGFTTVDGFGEDGNPLTAEHRRQRVVARL
jgi:2-polyprenyl-3-methyl-5-hydroxy-6-metoxy-1,4-benzoquinol methylase